MDTSKEYIKMCSKLPNEIRKLVPRDHCGCAGGDKSFFGYSKKLNGVVWLPRQDQLQGMLEYDDDWCFIKDFEVFVQNTSSKMYNGFEQLWLAFVMSEKYNKKWDGKEWIKI
jgi:hypothetical protein